MVSRDVYGSPRIDFWRDLIDLRPLHTELTQSVSEHLSKRPDDPKAQQKEAEALALLDFMFSQAMRIEGELRDAEKKTGG